MIRVRYFPGSGSGWPKKTGSDRIRIRNTKHLGALDDSALTVLYCLSSCGCVEYSELMCDCVYVLSAIVCVCVCVFVSAMVCVCVCYSILLLGISAKLGNFSGNDGTIHIQTFLYIQIIIYFHFYLANIYFNIYLSK